MAVKGLSLTIMLDLANKPSQTGYDLTKMLDDTMSYSGSHQQVYRELSKMVEKDYMTIELVPQEGKPDRKLHTLTNLGAAVVEEIQTKEWKPEEVSLAKEHGQSTVMLKAGNKSYFEALTLCLEMKLAELTRLVEQIDQQLREEQQEAARVDCLQEKVLIQRSIALHTAELDYAKSAIDTIEQIQEELNPQGAAA